VTIGLVTAAHTDTSPQNTHNPKANTTYMCMHTKYPLGTCTHSTRGWQALACSVALYHHQVTPCQPGSLCQSNNSTLVPKQHHQTLGEHCSPSGPVPDVAAPHHTRDKDNSSKWLLKDHPTHAALQFPNQTTAVGYPRTCGQQIARLLQTSTRRSWVSRAHATHSSSVCQVTTSAAVQPHVENRPRKPSM
jgi:hypothetical protein